MMQLIPLKLYSTIWLVICLISMADAINQFQLTSIFVDDRTVSSSTNLNFQL